MDLWTKSRSAWNLVGLLTCCILGVCNGATMQDYESLCSQLFANYNTGLRPRVNDTTPTYVNIGISLMSIQSLDEINQELTFTMNVRVDWLDPNLVWNPASHNGITGFTYPQKEIWLPDITIDNSVDTLEEFGFDRNSVYILFQGRVFWAPGGVFKTSCNIDVTYYPFDTQACSIKFTTRISTDSMVDLEFKSEPARTDEYTESGTWQLVSLTTESRPNKKDYTVVAFTLKLKRLTTYYVVAIIFPVLFLSLTATLVFALPADSGEKMGTSITVLLAFAVYLTIVADQMPKTSLNVSLLSVWLTMLLGMTALGVILTVWVINLHFRDDAHPLGVRMRRVVVLLQRLMRQRPWREQISPSEREPGLPQLEDYEYTSDADVIDPQKETSTSTFKKRPSTSDVPEMAWRVVAWTFDRFFFYFFSLFLAIFTIAFGIAIMAGA